jgi:signal transduction histidine kinase
MRERAELMGGEFALVPAAGGGTIVRVGVPLQMATRATGTPEEHEEEAPIG